jgi:hypothetical protein
VRSALDFGIRDLAQLYDLSNKILLVLENEHKKQCVRNLTQNIWDMIAEIRPNPLRGLHHTNGKNVSQSDPERETSP